MYRGKESMTLRAWLLVPPLLAAVASSAAAQAAPEPRHQSVLRLVAHAAGGAVLGSWTGYMASQVTWSDWRDGAGRGAYRIRFAVTGATLGLLAGAVIGRHRAGPEPGRAPRVVPFVNTRPITAEEIRASSARSVTELLRTLRPQWLRSRGTDVLRPSADPLAAPGVRVYLNGGLLGGLETLDQVSIDAITGVQFFDTAAATLRWGAGNDDGAILLLTGPTP